MQLGLKPQHFGKSNISDFEYNSFDSFLFEIKFLKSWCLKSILNFKDKLIFLLAILSTSNLLLIERLATDCIIFLILLVLILNIRSFYKYFLFYIFNFNRFFL